MTVTEFISAIARRSRTGDITKLDGLDRQDVLRAANSALMGLYNALPSNLRELTEGFTLPAPTTISLAATNNSTKVSTGTFSQQQIGQSIQISGDQGWNQILSPQDLLNPFQGPTGTTQGTIYGNACFSTRYPFDRIIGDPAFADNQFWPLARLTMNNTGRNGSWLYQQTVGRPINWWTQLLGNSQGNNPVLVIRFAPAPDMAYAINVRMSYWPLRLLLTDVQNATTLGVPDQYLDRCLIPMGWRALMGSPAWKSISPEADNLVITLAKEGEDFAKNQPGQVGAPDNRVGTPTGF
jgi:hypothetical protein